MKTYRFYGWQTANVLPKNAKYQAVGTPRDLYDRMDKIWCPASCTPRMRHLWSETNKTVGQCAITSFLVQDIYGGEVYGIPLSGGGFHCYNDVDGCVFDLTSEQFGDEVLVYEGNPIQLREVQFADEGKYQRYQYLVSELNKSLGIE